MESGTDFSKNTADGSRKRPMMVTFKKILEKLSVSKNFRHLHVVHLHVISCLPCSFSLYCRKRFIRALLLLNMCVVVIVNNSCSFEWSELEHKLI